jgi:hypothetical protein
MASEGLVAGEPWAGGAGIVLTSASEATTFP